MRSALQPVVIGAGPAGLSAAYELARHGTPSTILEADPRNVGGLSQTVEYRGFRFDIGGHRFFSKNAEVEQMWRDVLGHELIDVVRGSRIYYDNKYFDYPLRPLNALRNLGPMETVRCVASYFYAQLFPRQPVVSFEDWVVNHFGWRLFRIFFQTYTEKIWGRPCTEISADWAAQRIRNLNLFEAVRNALFGSARGSEVVKTLIDTFRYPRLGPGQMWERTADIVVKQGCDLRMGTRVARIQRTTGGGYRVFYERGPHSRQEEASSVDATHIISSMPLGHLAAALDPAVPSEVLAAARALTHRDFLTVAVVIDNPAVFPDNWIYIHDPMVRVGRVQNYKNWSPAMVPDPRFSCLGLEYFCFEGDGLWTSSDAELIDLATRELNALRLTKPEQVVDGTVVRMPRAYPVYDAKYRENTDVVRRYLEENEPNIQVAGRNGMHRYNNQDHAMLTGMIASRNLLGAHLDPWCVNGDAEYIEDGAAGSEDARAVPRSAF